MPSTWDPYYQTPFASRSLAVFVSLVHLSGFIVGDGNPKTYAYCPYALATHGQVYRIFTAPFVSDSIIGVLFAAVTLIQVGSHLERCLGTAHFALFAATFYLATSALFSLLVLGLGATVFPGMLTSCSLGMWPWLIACMVVQALTSGEETHRLMCFPVNVPSKWYPLALAGLFTLFFGLRIDICIAIGLSQQYANGGMRFLTPQESWVAKLEQLFGPIAHSTGFVPQFSASGFLVPIGTQSTSQAGEPWSLPSVPSMLSMPAWAGSGDSAAGTAPFPGHGQSIADAAPVAAARPLGSAQTGTLEAMIDMGFDRASAQHALGEHLSLIHI
eukprot:TRINITY_DN4874_c0_g1_i2.p1 TRINITY_DN4874_c0_g1~~TRINITY_DN4874_c0_g1_i2.p1  ORF type:complete len:329 (+),score=43.95 TRINITY_DN4874_c0_g1_i2:199-1185(+)